jgi:hypothetical protein
MLIQLVVQDVKNWCFSTKQIFNDLKCKEFRNIANMVSKKAMLEKVQSRTMQSFIAKWNVNVTSEKIVEAGSVATNCAHKGSLRQLLELRNIAKSYTGPLLLSSDVELHH